MREEGKDHAVLGFKKANDGWHIVEFLEGIDFLPGKGGEGIYQNERGFKTYKFPTAVKDEEDDGSNGADVNILIGVEKGGPFCANVLACVGLWEKVKQKFPGDDVSVFDKAVMDGIKIKLPGMSCMMRTELDKDQNVRVREMASFAKYKEILAEEKTKGKTGGGKKKDDKSTGKTEEKADAKPASDGWD
jgi:hypothetical protein